MTSSTVLPASEVLCPYCNAPNPPGITRCITCGTRYGSQTKLASSAVAPFVGRKVILDQLLSEMGAVRRFRRGRFVVVEGEPGIGKSRLARELVANLWDENQRIVTARAYADKRNTSYWLLSDILFHLFEFQPEMTLDDRRSQIEMLLMELFNTTSIAYTAAPFFWLLGLSDEREKQEMEELEPDQRQQRLYRSFQAVFMAAAGQKPLLLLIDDAHWADAISLDFISRLLDKRILMRMLLLMFTRPPVKEQDRALDRLLTETPSDESYIVEPLEDLPSEEALAGLLQGVVPQGLTRVLVPRAQGNPFLLEELMRTLMERNVLIQEDGQWLFTPEGGVTSMLLPLTVQVTVQERLSHLDQPARTLLELGSVMGLRLEREVLIEAIRALHYEWPGEVLDAAFTMLGQRGFLLGEEAGRFRFRHDLTQEIVSRELTPRQNAQYNEAIAQALETVYQANLPPVVERLAHHYTLSDNAERAIHYLRRVAALAAGHFAAAQAGIYFQRALQRFPEPLSQFPDLFLTYGDLLATTAHYNEARDIYQQGLAMTDPSNAPRFYCQLGVMYSQQAHYNEAEENYSQALKHIDPDNDALRSRLFSEMGWVRFQQGRLKEAETLFEEALALLENHSTEARARILNRMAGIAFRKGQLDQAHKLLTRAVDALAEAGDLRGMASAYNNLGSIYTYQGEHESGIEYRQQALELYERLGDVNGQIIVLLNLASLHMGMGRFTQAAPLAEKGLMLAREAGQQYEECFALSLLGWTRVHQGDLFMGREWLTESREIARTIGAADRLFESTSRLAEVLIYNEAVEEATNLVTELFATEHAPEYAPSLWRLRATLARRDGKLREAERTIQASLELMDQIRVDPLTRLLSLAEQVAILRAMERPDEMAALRQQALELWESAGPTDPLPPFLEVKLTPPPSQH